MCFKTIHYFNINLIDFSRPYTWFQSNLELIVEKQSHGWPVPIALFSHKVSPILSDLDHIPLCGWPYRALKI